MARRVIEVFEDDLDGVESPSVKTRSFGLSDTNYEIDLTNENYEKLIKALEPFIHAARVVGRDKPGKAKPKAKMSQSEQRKANEAARYYGRIVMGKKVTERGRVPAEVLKAWEDAGRPDKEQTVKLAQAIVDKHAEETAPAPKKAVIPPQSRQAKAFVAKQSMIEKAQKRNGAPVGDVGAGSPAKRAAKKAGSAKETTAT